MNGTTFAEAIFIPLATTEWRIAGAGDFNGDGFVGLIWQNSATGERGLWFMDETTMVGFSFLPTVSSGMGDSESLTLMKRTQRRRTAWAGELIDRTFCR